MPTLEEMEEFIKNQSNRILELKDRNKHLSEELESVKREYEALILEKERAIQVNINDDTLRIDLDRIKNLQVINNSSYKNVQIFADNCLIELNSIGNNNVIIGNSIYGKSNIKCNNLVVDNTILVQGEINSINTNIQSNRDFINEIDSTCRDILERAEKEYIHRYSKERYKY